jgi:hypothetical protein
MGITDPAVIADQVVDTGTFPNPSIDANDIKGKDLTGNHYGK